MSSKTLLFVGIIVIITGAVIYYLLRGRGGRFLSTTADGETCVKVGSDVKRWQSDMNDVDWGQYGPMKKKYLDVTHGTTESDYVDGFFKAIDAQPHSKLVRTYSREIKAWLESGRADKHWLVNLGELRCNLN